MKEIYKNWAATKGGSVDDWLKICGDNIDFGSLAQGAAPKVQYMTDYSSRDALRDYFAGLTRDWEMIEYVADEFVAQGDRVVMLGRCSWRFQEDRQGGIDARGRRLDDGEQQGCCLLRVLRHRAGSCGDGIMDQAR